VTYSREHIAAYFDRLAEGEWFRYDRTPLGLIHLHQHETVLRQCVHAGARVLEIGAGPGRFTRILHELNARVVVGDISAVQLALHRKFGQQHGFDDCVEARLTLDISDLGALTSESFDVVVAYGGPLSYVFELRDVALQHCRRVLRPRGTMLLSVMSLFGTLHRHLGVIRDLPVENTLRIVSSGDLAPDNEPTSEHRCHLFRSDELRDVLTRNGFAILSMAASNALATNLDPLLEEIRSDPIRWDTLLACERLACAHPGFLDGGTHLIAAAQRTD